MQLRRVFKTAGLILISLVGILFLLFLFLNLSFSQSFLIKRVNSVLAGSGVPIHIGSIKTILPRTVKVQDISIVSPEGDTLIYAGEVASRFHPVGLLRRKVMLENVRLESIGVTIDRNESTQLLKIEEVFSPGSPEEKVKKESEPKSWEIYIRGADLSRISFNMPDSLEGICISQEVESLYLSSFYLSTGGQEILFGDLDLKGAGGSLLLEPPVKPDDETPAEPWVFGFSSVAIQDLQYNFNSKQDSLMLDINVEEGLISSNKMDIEQKVIDLKRIMLAGSKVVILTGKSSTGKEAGVSGDRINFPWQIGAGEVELGDIEIIPCGCYYSDYSDPPVDNRISVLDLDLSDFYLEQSGVSADLRNLGFKLENGFELKNSTGKLESDGKSVRLALDLESGNSHVEAVATADGSFFELVSSPDIVQKARLTVRDTEFSPADLAFFIQEAHLSDLLQESAQGSFRINADLGLNNETLNIANIMISQKDHFDLSVSGQAEDPFHPARSVIDLQLGIAEMDSSWLNGLLTGLGIEQPVGIPGGLVMESSFTGQSIAPDFRLNLHSNQGNLALDGSTDFKAKSFDLHFLFENIKPDQLFGIRELTCIYGKGMISGSGLNRNDFIAKISLEADTVTLNNYDYTGISLTAGWQDNTLDLDLNADDPSFQAAVRGSLYATDSLLTINSTTTIFAQLNDLGLMEDTISVDGELSAEFRAAGQIMSGNLQVKDLNFETPLDQAGTGEINLFLETDSLRTTLTGDGQFFTADIRIKKPLDQFGTLMEDYTHYLKSLIERENEDSTDRIALLPEMNVNIHFVKDDFIMLLIGEPTMDFSNFDLFIKNRHADQNLTCSLEGKGLAFKVLKIGDLVTGITDSAGVLNLKLAADKNLVNDVPVHRLQVAGRYANWKSLTGFRFFDATNRISYDVEIAASVDSNLVILEVPSQKMVLNYAPWQMQTPELLSIDLSDNNISPSLSMFTERSSIRLLTKEENDMRILSCEVDGVQLSSLIKRDLIPGNPDGVFSGSLEYDLKADSSRYLATNVGIRELKWSDMVFNKINMDGTLSSPVPGSYKMKVSGQMDAASFRMEGEKKANDELAIRSSFSDLPVQTIQPFTEKYLSDLRGAVSGDFNLRSLQENKSYKGTVYLKEAALRVNMLNSSFRIPGDSIRFNNDRIILDKFTILDSLNHSLQVDGSVNLDGEITANLSILSRNIQLMRAVDDEDVPFTGNIFVDSRLSVNGPVMNPEVRGTLMLNRGTEVYYRYTEDLSLSESEKVMTFVSHEPVEEDQEIRTPVHLRNIGQSTVATVIRIDPSTKIHFNLSRKIFDIGMMIMGGGDLNYQMLSNNNMSLSGKYDISEGGVEMKIVGWPNKSFTITPGGFVRWDGRIEDPELNVEAVNRVRTTYINPVDGNKRYVDFNVLLQLSNHLSEIDMRFTCNTPDQYIMSMINTLSPEEQMQQALTILLLETVDLPGISTSMNYMQEQVNQLVASQLNQLTKANIKGVDISFGIDTYKEGGIMENGPTTSSLTYEVKKDLFDNRAQFEVSGRIEELNRKTSMSDMSLTNISLEYRLDSAATKYLKVYNQHTYEDVFDGEVSSTGIGIKFRKRFRTFSDIWKRKEKNNSRKDKK